MKSMEDQMRLMKESYASLLERHIKLQSDYTKDKDNWKRFKDWWQEKMEHKRQLTQISSSSTPANKKSSNDAEKEALDSAKGRVNARISDSNSTNSNFCDEEGNDRNITNSERRILKDVGLPFRSHFNDRRITDIMPTPSRYKSFLDNSSPAEDRLKRTEKLTKKSRLSEESIMSSPMPHNSTRKPLSETMNANTLSYPGPSDLHRNASTEKDSRPKTINQEFEIIPEMNGNVTYLHKDVVRSKVKRKQMHAHDCECCRDFYDAVGPVAVRPFEDVRKADLYREDDENTNEKSENVHPAKESARKRQEHLQKISRHRDYGPPPSTPKDYWQIGYPNTQMIEEINRTADAAERRKREEMENDPRYRRRKT